MAVALVWSCGKDDGPTPPSNTAPVMADQSFNAAETIGDTETIGTVKADDKDGDDLTFSITTDASDLFEISDSGALSLKPGKSLNFDTAESYTITVAVTDGEEETTATITITVGDQNTAAPVFGQASYQFEESEGIATTIIIGIVDATDDDDTDELTFAIAENDNGLFEINNAGEISLSNGMELDYETATVHSIVVSVTDGTETVETEVTITVQNVPEADSNDTTAFVTTWGTDNDGDNITIGLQVPNAGYDFDFTINWGDGTIENITGSTQNISHEYAVADTYTVAINGVFPSMYMAYIDAKSLKSIEQWGTIQWKSLRNAFGGCGEMIYNATDNPDLSNVTDMHQMFGGADLFNGDIGDWDVSSVTDMSFMFVNASSFNQNLGGWNVSNVTNMGDMFKGATSFEGVGLENWNVSNVSDMNQMFKEATAFNGNVNGWTTGSVTNMNGVFMDATSFNRNLGAWDIGSVDPNNDGGMNQMLDNSGMSPANYSATLIGWADQATAPKILGAQGLFYCQEAQAAHDLFLFSGWGVDDEGLTDQCGL